MEDSATFDIFETAVLVSVKGAEEAEAKIQAIVDLTDQIENQQVQIDVDFDFEGDPIEQLKNVIADFNADNAIDSLGELGIAGSDAGDDLDGLAFSVDSAIAQAEPVLNAFQDVLDSTGKTSQQAEADIDELVNRLKELPGPLGRLGEAIGIAREINELTAEFSGLNDALAESKEGFEAAEAARAASFERNLPGLSRERIDQLRKRAVKTLDNARQQEKEASKRLDEAGLIGVTDEQTGSLGIELRPSLNAAVEETARNVERVRAEIAAYDKQLALLDATAERQAANFEKLNEQMEIQRLRAEGTAESLRRADELELANRDLTPEQRDNVADTRESNRSDEAEARRAQKAERDAERASKKVEDLNKSFSERARLLGLEIQLLRAYPRTEQIVFRIVSLVQQRI